MKKFYNDPEIQITKFLTENIITASGGEPEKPTSYEGTWVESYTGETQEVAWKTFFNNN